MQPRNTYLYAVIITISVILLNQTFIQFWLNQKRTDANRINIGGKQRMLSQQLLVKVYQFQKTKNPDLIDQINKINNEWRSSHFFLSENSPPSRFLFTNDSKWVNDQLDNLYPYIQTADEYINNSITADDFDLNAFEKNQSAFLTKMDAVVSKMAALSNKKLNLVIYIEIIFAILSLLLIFYEIIFVFKKINNRLKLKNDQLAASNELLENYAYLAAHNLRSPIQNISNFGNLLKEKIGANSALANKYLNFILESGKDLDQTTKELLYFSQLNNTKLQFEACDPKEIIEKSISSLDKKINEIDAKITYSNLPKSIIADQILLKLAFQNLISNGIKFSNKSTRPTINIEYESNKGYHKFHIHDNGIGITKENQEKIFHLFKTLHHEENYSGKGNGLAICKNIIARHKGKIELESRPGKGSKFTIAIPEKLNANEATF